MVGSPHPALTGAAQAAPTGLIGAMPEGGAEAIASRGEVPGDESCSTTPRWNPAPTDHPRPRPDAFRPRSSAGLPGRPPPASRPPPLPPPAVPARRSRRARRCSPRPPFSSRTPGPSKARASTSCRPGSARTRTSSPARSRVSGRIGDQLAVAHDEADPRVAGSPARSPMVRPSAGEPAATVSRWTPLGLVAQPHAERPGLGLDRAHRHPQQPGRGRHQAALDDHGEHHDDGDDAVEAFGRPARARRAGSSPSRIGTAPLRPANRTKPRSLAVSRAGTRHSPTTSGRMTKASAAPRTRPGIHTSARASTARSTVSPRTTNATISARLASAEWNRSISRLYGARSSPMRIPATNTARNPEPCARVATPNSSSAQASVRSGYRPSPGSGTRRMNHSSARPPATPTAAPTRHLQHELGPDVAERARGSGRRPRSGWPSARSRPGRSRRTRPSRMVPLRPDDLPLAEHREHHRRVGRARRRSRPARRRTSRARSRVQRAPLRRRRSGTCRRRRRP